MVIVRMTLLMKKFINIDMDDGGIHPLKEKESYFLLSATCDEILSWVIGIWMKSRLVSVGNCNTVNL